MKRGEKKTKINTKDIPVTTIIVPYLITIFWIASFLGLFISNDTIVKIFCGMISGFGFVVFIFGRKNLKNLRISATGIEVSISEEKKKTEKG